PEWFIKLFTREYDTVLDPFMGSGTTLFVANRMKRNSIGIDNVHEYCEMAQEKLKPVELYLFEPKVKYEKAKTKGRSTLR
ncbi:MAG: site-specific DNA-methyltransferase, partial [Deltaproteobacteria bacterium HGW-Deltaproteobacteria-10]